jgi:NitT/TauT family transport system substrate-binding protein
MTKLIKLTIWLLFTSLSLTITTAKSAEIVLGSAPNLQTVPILVAMDKGYFSEEDLTIKLVKFVSGRRALEALIGGQLDIAFMSEYPVAIAALRDQKFATISTLSHFKANRLISKGSIGFKSLSDLDGKKIGTTKGSNTEFFTELLIAESGISVEVINVSPGDIVTALARGDIDAGVMFPDFYPAAKKTLGDDYREFVSQAYIAQFVLSASPKILNERQDDVVSFLRALIKAEKFIKANPDEAQAIYVAATQGRVTLAEAKAQWDEAYYGIELTEGLVDLLVAEGEWVISKGVVEGKATPELIKKYLATGPLMAIDKSRVTLD